MTRSHRRLDLTGRHVRTVSWHGRRKLTSDPLLVLQVLPKGSCAYARWRPVLALQHPSGQLLLAYSHECELALPTSSREAA